MVFIEGYNGDGSENRYENEADQFAADTLIPTAEYNSFVEANEFYPENMKKFAESINIDVGIVIGRLQHDQYIDNSWHNSLRTRYTWLEKE